MLKQIQERLGVLDALCAAPRRFPLRMSAIRKNNTGHNVVTLICYNTQIKNASAFLPRRAWCEAPSLMRGCDPPCLSMRSNAPVEHCVAEAFNL